MFETPLQPYRAAAFRAMETIAGPPIAKSP